MNRVKSVNDIKDFFLRKSLRGGFTMIEVIVVIGILAIIMGTVVGTGSSGRTQFNLSISQEKLRALVSRAKGLSLSNVAQPGGVTVSGYGVHIIPGQAFIFADRNNNRVYNAGEEISGETNKMILKGDAFFADITNGAPNPPNFGGSGGMIDVLFLPPDPTTYINGVNSGQTIIGITSMAGSVRAVTVTSSGLISTVSY